MMMSRRTPHRRLRVAIVGAGMVGQSLGRVLVGSGDRIVAVISRSKGSAAKGARFLRCSRHGTTLDVIPRETDVVMITTPHAAVGAVAQDLAGQTLLDFRRLAVCHASGMLTAEVLGPAAALGAAVFSFHPLQTFPRDFSPQTIWPTARGIYYGVDGSPRGIRKAKDLARRLQGRVIQIPPEMRAFYHAACVVASNHLAALLSVVERMHAELQTREKKYFPVFQPLIRTTLENIGSTSPARALSGPVARGGVETVAGHFNAVAQFAPELIPYFAAMSLETVRLALAIGSINDQTAERMSEVIRQYTGPSTSRQERS